MSLAWRGFIPNEESLYITVWVRLQNTNGTVISAQPYSSWFSNELFFFHSTQNLYNFYIWYQKIKIFVKMSNEDQMYIQHTPQIFHETCTEQREPRIRKIQARFSLVLLSIYSSGEPVDLQTNCQECKNLPTVNVKIIGSNEETDWQTKNFTDHMELGRI